MHGYIDRTSHNVNRSVQTLLQLTAKFLPSLLEQIALAKPTPV